MQARIRIHALVSFVLLAAVGAAAQEVVLTDGSRLPGTVERYENGFAYVRLVQEGGKTVLTTMPESAVDKAATEERARALPAAIEPEQEARTGPFKLPHNDLSARAPGIADVASAEKERRAEAMGSGAATGRVFKNGQRAGGIPTGREVEALADLREQPQALPDMDVADRVAGLRFYEARLDALASAYVRLGDEWNDMWAHCTPINYVGAGERPPTVTRPHTSYDDAVMGSFRRSSATRSVGDHWSVSCVRRDSDYIARGKQVVEAYDVVFAAYAEFVQRTGQSPDAVARALPQPGR